MPSAFHKILTKQRKRKRKPPKYHKRDESAPPLAAAAAIATAGDGEEEDDDGDEGFRLKHSSSSRTLTIQPLGNQILRRAPNIRNPGLGTIRALPDDLLLDLLALLPAKDLARLSLASKSLYVFASHDPLWRSLVLQDLADTGFLFHSSWRSTYYLSASSPSSYAPPRSLSIADFYSDYLFQSWLCANLEMKPDWLARDNIPRRRGISVAEFVSSFEEPNKPVLLEGCLDEWPAMEKWTREGLIRAAAGVKFAVGPVEMSLEGYFRYADAAREERPLYLFDPKFAEKVPEFGADYDVPVYFREDLFGLLGTERPDYRWVIIGPAGSGSSFHVDPNSTSAWNAVISGKKKWVMFPPEVVPPGVHPSPDGAEVACPVSIMEWFMNFYGQCKNWKKRPVECVCKAGEVVFVPNGWWHLVINLEDSVAITQNYVSRRNLLNVLEFLKKPNASELVSGTKDRVNLHDKFRSAIEAAFPGTIEQLTLEAQEKLAQQRKPTFWESVTDANVGGFKFSF